MNRIYGLDTLQFNYDQILRLVSPSGSRGQWFDHRRQLAEQLGWRPLGLAFAVREAGRLGMRFPEVLGRERSAPSLPQSR